MTRLQFIRGAVLAVAMSIAPALSAQEAEHEMHGGQSESGLEYMAAMDSMMDAMAAMKMTGDAGVDFAMMMIPHHQSAIDMADSYLDHGDDPELTELAHQVISEQRREIEILKAWLEANR